MTNTLLTIESLNAGYGEIQVLKNVDISLTAGSITVLMGPNGAGKSTLLKSIFNITDIETGKIRYNGENITGLPPYALLKRGIAFVSQGKVNFSTLSIRDNLLLGAHHVSDTEEVQRRLEQLYDTFPVLRKKQKEYAFSLSGGEQQMLAIARALMSNPTLLLMDEPSLGLAPKLVQEVFEKIVEIKETYDTTIVVVEHNLKTLMKMADYGYILVQGEVVAHDTCDVLKDSEIMKQVCLLERLIDMQVTPIQTSIFEADMDLFSFITAHVPTVEERTILVVTSKIVAIAEGRVRTLTSKEDRIALIKQESDIAIETPWTWLTVTDGQIYASAGIDESNVGAGVCVLLPEDSYKSAQILRTALCEYYGITELGILISDSRVPPLRQGTVGVALGYAGFEGVRDYRGTKDIYGRPFKVSRTNVADSLSTAATLCMGEGSETQPLASITNAPVEFTNREIKKEEIEIPLKDDMYLPFFKDLELL